MSDFITIWQGVFNVTLQFWNFLMGFGSGIVIALIVVSIMLITLKRIFFSTDNDK